MARRCYPKGGKLSKDVLKLLLVLFVALAGAFVIQLMENNSAWWLMIGIPLGGIIIAWRILKERRKK